MNFELQIASEFVSEDQISEFVIFEVFGQDEIEKVDLLEGSKPVIIEFVQFVENRLGGVLQGYCALVSDIVVGVMDF